MHMIHKGLVFSLYKELLHIERKKSRQPIKKWKRFGQSIRDPNIQ